MLTPLRSAVLALLLAFQLLLPACADASRPLGLGLNHHRGGILGGGQIGGGIAGVTYDASFGTGTDASGFATLPLRSGAVRIFVNSSTGSDSNTCTQAQSAATPKATFKSVWDNCVVDGEGDQILLAQGTSYSRGLARLHNKAGYSLTYPLVIQSYDPADPTNEAKLGRATGSQRPVVDLTGVDMSGSYLLTPDTGESARSNYVIRGLEFNSGNVADLNVQVGWNATSGPYNNILFENDVFAYYTLTFSTNDPVYASNLVVRHSAFYGEWSSASYSQGLYGFNTDGLTAEDNVFWHAGWKVGAARTDPPNPNGGPQTFAHAVYTNQGTVNTVVRRNAFIDNSSDAGELKGGGVYQGNLSINNPIGPFLGFHQNVYSTLQPYGVYIDATGNVVLGTDGGAQNWGIETADSKQGVGLSRYNVVAQVNTTGGYWGYGLMTDAGADAYDVTLPTYMTWDHNVVFNWGNHAGYAAASSCLNTDSGKCSFVFPTYTNNRWDDATSGSNTNVTGGFSNAYTPITIITALGYPDLATAEADFIAHPDQAKWEAGTALALTGYGVTLPVTADIATDMRITAGIANSGQFVGALDGSVLTSSDLPACIALDSSSRAWRATSACTAQSATVHVTETPPTGPPHTTAIALNVYARPTHSSVSVSGITSSGATLNFTPSVGSGTEFYNVATTSFTGAWQYVRASHHGAGSDYISGTVTGGSQSVASTSPQTVPVTGLSASTAYYFNEAQLDANNNPTLTSSTTFTTTGAAWTPATVLANLAWWAEPKPANLTKLGGGTPADGDQVSAITDLSGNSVALSQSTTGAYPIYHTDGSHYWLTFDGSNDQLRSTATPIVTDGSGQHTSFATVNPSSTTGVQAIVDTDTSTRVSQNLRTNAGTLETIAFNTVPAAFTDAGPSVGSGTVHVVSEKTTTTTTEAFVDGTGNGSTAVTGTLQNGFGTEINLGGHNNSSSFFAGNWYGGFIYKGVMGSTDLSGAQTYMRSLAP